MSCEQTITLELYSQNQTIRVHDVDDAIKEVVDSCPPPANNALIPNPYDLPDEVRTTLLQNADPGDSTLVLRFNTYLKPRE
jgi:hypothetical protein